MTPGYKHAPGVACIVTGLRGKWAGQDNGRIVVITALYGLTPKGQNIWKCRVRDGEPPLHTFGAKGKNTSLRVRALQRYLIPIGPDGVLAADELVQAYRDAHPALYDLMTS